MSEAKLAEFRNVDTGELLRSLRPGQVGALKVKGDGTMMDGHHRVEVLRERGVDVDALDREIVEPNKTPEQGGGI